MAIKKMTAIFALMVNAAISEKSIIIGLLAAIRITIINACCTLVTSVVRRVTILAVENLSMFENAKLIDITYYEVKANS